jgi:hypothetical protein
LHGRLIRMFTRGHDVADYSAHGYRFSVRVM